MGGRSSKEMPGFLYLLGPIHDTGLQRSDQIGSVRILRPSIWIRNVACPTGVMLRVPTGTLAAGAGPVIEFVSCGHSGQSVPKIKRHIHQPRPLGGVWFGLGDEGWEVSGLKKSRPSKWSEICPVFSASMPGSVLPAVNDKKTDSTRERIRAPNP